MFNILIILIDNDDFSTFTPAAMKKIRNFRPINTIEQQIIENSLKPFYTSFRAHLEEMGESLFISFNTPYSQESDPHIFILPRRWEKEILALSEPSEIVSAGLYFGFVKKDTFFLSLEGSEYLYKNRLVPPSMILISSENGEKSILYGNDITKKDLKKFPKSLERDKIYLVINQNGEIIALSRARLSSKDLNKENSDQIIFQTLIDKGYYLRAEQ